MDIKIYVYIDNQQQGPYSLKDVQQMYRDGKIAGDTLVWHDALTEWKPFALVIPLPEKRRKKFLIPIIISAAALLLIGGGIGGYFWYQNYQEEQEAKRKEEAFLARSRDAVKKAQGKDENYKKAVEFLKSADLTTPTREKAEYAAWAADGDALEKLKENGFSDWNDDPWIIIYACRYGSVELVEKLINYGCDINAKSDKGFTTLMSAAVGNNLAMVRYLVEQKKLDLKACSNYGSNALHYAALRGNLETVKYLLDEKKMDINAKTTNLSQNVLHNAAENGHLELVKYLINEKKMDIYAQAKSSFNILHLAAINGHLMVVKYLIEEKGMPVNIKADYDITPLRGAKYGKHHDVVRYLESKGGVE